MAITETNPPVTHRRQPASKLCWATSILMLREVMKGWNPDITPDRIVQRTLYADAGTNVTGQENVIVSAMQDWTGGGRLVRGPISIDNVKANIDADKPIILGINWYSGGDHAIVVGGYDKKGPDWGLLRVFDPLAPGPSTVSTDRLKRGDYDPNYRDGGENLGVNSRYAGIWDATFVVP